MNKCMICNKEVDLLAETCHCFINGKLEVLHDECIENVINELKELKDGITGVYQNMIALEIINKKTDEEIEIL